MIDSLYYKAPEDKIFNGVKQKAMALWHDIDSDKYGYASEKIKRVRDFRNIRDNFMSIVSMFDIHNQAKLANTLNDEEKKAIRERLRSAGIEDEYIVF